MLSRKQRLINALGRHTPWLFRVLRSMVRLLGEQSYEENRRHMNYYREVLRLVEGHVGTATSVVDVGSAETDLIEQLTGFAERHTVDIRYAPPRPGIRRHTANFFDWQPPIHFDLALCLQVLEHVHDPTPFARKLFEIADRVIITVPYKWPAGICAGHVQDPVDEAKLAGWAGREPDHTLIVDDGMKRLIAVYL
jgi:hypothetical protein